MLPKLVVAAVVALVLLPRSASSQSIGIFLDAAATCRSAQVGAAPLLTLHVVAFLGGSVSGITGASFRIDGPVGWTQETVFWVVDQSVTVGVGHPMFQPNLQSFPGTYVSFSSCRSRAMIPLGRLILNSPPTPPNTHVQVLAFTKPPFNPQVAPQLILCDAPFFTAVNVVGGAVVLNPSDVPGCTIVAVAQDTWGKVKSLYR